MDATPLEGHANILLYIVSTPPGDDPRLKIPPPSFTELHGRLLRYVPRRELSIEFPFDPRFTNPTGSFQGGMVAALIDNGFGFLSYLAAGCPCLTISLNVTYIRGFNSDDRSVTVDTGVVARSPTLITLKAEVKNPKGKLVASAVSQLHIVR